MLIIRKISVQIQPLNVFEFIHNFIHMNGVMIYQIVYTEIYTLFSQLNFDSVEPILNKALVFWYENVYTQNFPDCF